MRFLSFLSFLFSLIIGAVLLAGMVWVNERLGADGFSVDAPVREFQEATTQTQDSVVNIPFSVPIARIESELADLIPNRILQINERRDKCVDHQVDLLVAQTNITIACRIRGAIRKDGNLRISGEDGQLKVQLPVKFNITVKALSGILSGAEETVTGSIMVTARMLPRLKPNWTFGADLETNFRWRERASIEVLGFKIDLGSQMRGPIDEALKGLKPELVKLLNQINVKQQVTSAWRQLQQPRRIAQNPNVWLGVSPKSIHFSGLRVGDTHISANIALRAQTSTLIGPKPEIEIDRDLPNLRVISGLPSGFNVTVPVVVKYGAVERLLASQKIGDRLVELVDPDNYTMELSNFDVYPHNKSIVIGFDYDVDGPGALVDAQGRTYLSGRPRVNWNTKVIRFRDMYFAGVANNAVVDAASLIVSQRPILQIAEDNAIIPFAYEFEQLTKQVNEVLSQDLGGGVTTRGELQSTDVDDIRFTKEGIELIVTLQGSVRVSIN